MLEERTAELEIPAEALMESEAKYSLSTASWVGWWPTGEPAQFEFATEGLGRSLEAAV